eukprot:g5346.t1
MTLRSGTAQALDPVRSAFALAALLSVLLNFGVVVLAPLFQFECAPEPIEERTPNARRLGVPVPAAARSTPGRGQIAEAWSCLHPVDPDTLRLLPDSSALAQQARQKPRWLFFGLSSVHRKQAEYLGITLSHLFDALGDSTDTGLVIHLADFDESWVAQTQDWLKTGFEDEVQENRMHVIHAPERLYPAKAEVMKYTKYGDPPLRQWWRAKQNLDYAFLMWYAANLSEYYMQLEDDVQVTPNFLPTVRRFMHEKLTGDAWVMAAFSKLGFIGKLFHSSRLPKLAEFLLIFHGEAPCDWLVWVFIDAVSKDLEDEHNQRESAKSNPNVKLSKSMRSAETARADVLLYYKEKKMPVFLSNPAPVIQKITPPPAPLDTAPSSASSGSLPVGHVASLIDTWQNSPMSEAFSPMGARRTQKLFVDGRIKVEGILDLAERLARVETQQRILHESLAGIERGGALNRCEEQEVNGSTLKLRLEALAKFIETREVQTKQALEEQLCRDLVVQNGSLEMLQTQLGSLHEQLPRTAPPNIATASDVVSNTRVPGSRTRTVAARLEERFNLELPKARQSTTQQIAREVREAVRGEYQRLVWQLAGPEPREVLTTRSPSLEKAQLEPPPKPAEPRPGA